MASILVEDHRDDEAERYLKQLLDSEPQNKKALNNLGNIKRKNSQFDEAISLYKLIEEHSSFRSVNKTSQSCFICG